MIIDKLLELSDQVLALPPGSPQLISAIESYTESFSAWLREQGGEVDLEKAKDELPALKKLAEQHIQILDRAKGAKGEILEELRQIEVRGRAIMAYIDQAPKRISQQGVKKG